MASVDLTNLLELDLIQNVLVPLFEKMGFQMLIFTIEVSPNKGKDITMWEASRTGARSNIAVVAKRGRINAGASGSDSVRTVFIKFGSALVSRSQTREAEKRGLCIGA